MKIPKFQITTGHKFSEFSFVQANLVWMMFALLHPISVLSAPIGKEGDANTSRLEMVNPRNSPLKSFEAQENVNEFTFDKSPEGLCVISCVAKMTPEKSDDWANANVKWSISPGVEGSTLEWGKKDSSGNIVYGAGNNTGLEVYIRFRGLPKKNSSFGLKTITVTAGKQSKSNPVEIFFSKQGFNHPVDTTVDQPGTPNWYYYWSQTPAGAGNLGPLSNPTTTLIYSGTLVPGETGRCYFETSAGKWISHIEPQAAEATAYSTWGAAMGIDLFANICRHEEQHREDMSAQWGVNTNWDARYDADGDLLRYDAAHPADGINEVTIAPSVPETVNTKGVMTNKYLPDETKTFKDHWQYLSSSSSPSPIPDVEHYCLGREPTWVKESANKQDWSSPGMQHGINKDYGS